MFVVVLAGVMVCAFLAHLGAPAAEARSCAEPPPGAPVAQTAAALGCELGSARARAGLPRMHTSRRLTLAAGRYADDMAARDFFSHVSPEGARLRDRILHSHWVTLRCGWYVGEVLAWGSGANATAAWTVGAWLDSPRHRRIVLRQDVDAFGVGVADGGPVATPAGLPVITVAALLGHRDCPVS